MIVIEDAMEQRKNPTRSMKKVTNLVGEYEKEFRDFNDSVSPSLMSYKIRIEEWVDELVCQKERSGKGLTKVNKKALLELATQEEIDSFQDEYLRIFEGYTGVMDDDLQNDDEEDEHQDVSMAQLQDKTFQYDLGVEKECKMALEELKKSLGLPTGKGSFPLISKWRLDSLYTPWEKNGKDMIKNAEQDVAKGKPLPEKVAEMDLRWHQYCAIHSWVRMNFKTTVEKSDNGNLMKPEGVLLADEVGLGKTPTVFGIIAFLDLVAEALDGGHALPKILTDLGNFYSLFHKI